MHARGVKDACLCGGSTLPPEYPHRCLVTVGLARPCQKLWFGIDSSYCNWRDVLQKPSCLEAWKKLIIVLGQQDGWVGRNACCASPMTGVQPSTYEREAGVKVHIWNSRTPTERWKAEVAGSLKSLSTSFSQFLNGAETNKDATSQTRWKDELPPLKVVFWPPHYGACVQTDDVCETLSCVLPLTRCFSIRNAFLNQQLALGWDS